jgi:citrate synthase
MSKDRLLSTHDVAVHLGVKKATVYAYVSRGLLTSRRNGEGKESLFSEAEVKAFAAQRRRGAATLDQAGSPVIHTGITLVTDEALYFRGHDATSIARRQSFESVANLLWSGELREVPFTPDRALRDLAEAVTAPLPASSRLTDRLRVIVAAAGAADRLRFDTTRAAVIATGRTIIGTMVAALPLRSREAASPEGFALAAALWSRLSTVAPSPDRVAVLNAALVLLADHDLAASTYAARVAASTRAHPYAVVGAGLAALDGPLHGAASSLVVEMLTAAVRSGDALGTISDRLRAGGGVPGFGHPLYGDGDPRAATLLELSSALPAIDIELEAGACEGRRARDLIDEVAAAMESRAGARPNIDFALASFTLLNGMRPDAGEAIFAIARTAGWIAHAIEEYSDQPSRFRPNGRYAGSPPSSGSLGNG